MRRSREITDKFVHHAETSEQMRRRYRKSILKKEFRETALKVAEKVFGEKSGLIDIIREEENCSEAIAVSLLKLSSSEDFDRTVMTFFSSVMLEKGGLEKGEAIAEAIAYCHPDMKDKALAAAVELLMGTEDEKLVLDFLQRVNRTEPDLSINALEGLVKISGIEYIHTMAACAEGFIKNPEAASAQIGIIASKTGRMSISDGDSLFSDIIILEVVKENLGLG